MPAADVDAYLAGLTPQAAEAVAAVRRVVHAAVPGAEETIAYGIPTFTLRGHPFVHVGAWTSYLSTYPVPDPDDPELASVLDAHRAGKGTLRFRYVDGVPVDVMTRIVALLAEQRVPSASSG